MLIHNGHEVGGNGRSVGLREARTGKWPRDEFARRGVGSSQGLMGMEWTAIVLWGSQFVPRSLMSGSSLVRKGMAIDAPACGQLSCPTS